MGGGDLLSVNLFDTKEKELFYDDTFSFYKERLDFFKGYEKHILLYFYGFGLGIFYSLLLEQNKNLKHIVVFEDDCELLRAVFFELDFSQYLRENKIIILGKNYDFYKLFSQRPFFSFLLLYYLHIHSKHYDKKADKILALQKELSNTIKQLRISRGNDGGDTLQGISNFLENLKDELSNPSFKELKQKRKNASKTAIIVSTGPSLYKHLALLKTYENKASIFCSDSAYTILCENKIQCDYVLMSERSELTAKLLERNFIDFDENILFVMMSVVHPLSIEFLKKYKRKFMILHHKCNFTSKFKLKDFCALLVGGSVAHNAFLLAKELGHENIIFIGQDLAYASNGASHSKGYIYSEFFESDFEKQKTLAYGAKSLVDTNEMWQYFRYVLQDLIKIALSENKNLRVINATQGGARIDFTEELSFRDCAFLLDDEVKKPFKSLDVLDEGSKTRLLKKCQTKIKELIKRCDDFIAFLEFNMKKIQDEIDKQNLKELMRNLEKLFTRIDEKLKKYDELYELSIPYFTQLELNVSKLSLEKDSELKIIEQYVESISFLLVNAKLLREILSKNV